MAPDKGATVRIDLDLLHSTIGQLYAAVGNPSAFDAVLQRVRTLFGASRVALITHLKDRECLYYESPRAPEARWQTASVSRGGLDKALFGSPVDPGTGNVCSGCVTAKRVHRLCCCVAHPKTNTSFLPSFLPSVHLSVHREGGSTPFDASDRRALEWLGPHFLQAANLSARIEAAESASNLRGQALEAVRRGVVVLNSRREVVFLNRRAEAMCDGRGLALSMQTNGQRTLRATVAADDLVLQRAVDDALALGSTTEVGSSSSSPVRIGGLHDDGPLLIRVARLPASSASGGSGSTVLFIDDLAVKELGDDRLLTAMFGLTRAEVRIARALLAGERPKAIAVRFAVSEDTVRTQLRSMYEKTETRGLAALLALLSRLAEVPVASVCESLAEPTSTTRSQATQASRVTARAGQAA